MQQQRRGRGGDRNRSGVGACSGGVIRGGCCSKSEQPELGRRRHFRLSTTRGAWQAAAARRCCCCCSRPAINEEAGGYVHVRQWVGALSALSALLAKTRENFVFSSFFACGSGRDDSSSAKPPILDFALTSARARLTYQRYRASQRLRYSAVGLHGTRLFARGSRGVTTAALLQVLELGKTGYYDFRCTRQFCVFIRSQ